MSLRKSFSYKIMRKVVPMCINQDIIYNTFFVLSSNKTHFRKCERTQMKMIYISPSKKGFIESKIIELHTYNIYF